MNWKERDKLNEAIASLHSESDVSSLTIDKKRRIKFPRGYLRPFNYYRDYFPYIKRYCSFNQNSFTLNA